MAQKLSKKELKEYVEEQLDSGHTVGGISEHLAKYGHTRHELDPIFDDILDEEESKKRNVFKMAAEILFISLFVMFIFWVGMSSSASGESVFIGFLPTIVFVVLSLALGKRENKSIFLMLPLGFAFLFYISGKLSSISVFANMEVGNLTVLNLVLSYIFIFLVQYSTILSSIRLSFLEPGEDEEMDEPPKKSAEGRFDDFKRHFAGQEQQPATYKESRSQYIEIPEKHEPLKKVVESLEGNCKALNSVIGRVYRRINGGTNLVRELIHVKSEWYNGFSELMSHRQNNEELYKLIDKIEKRLNLLFRKEFEVFGTTQFKNLKRDPTGNSRIIDTLMMNDNDPVQTYFENALMACGDAKILIGAVK